MDRSGAALKTETEHTEKLDSKKRSVQLSSSDDKNGRTTPKRNGNKKIKSAYDDKNYLSMSASLDIGHILRRKQKNKLSETSITRNKVPQDQDDTNKEAKVGIRIEGTKNPSVCVTPHPSVLTPTPYENNQYCKGGTNDKTHDSHTCENGVSRSGDDSLAINLDSENKNI